MATPEGEVVNSICEYLQLKGYLFWRNNNTPIYDPTRRTFRAMPKYTMKGLPDIIVIKDGHFTGIEVKSKMGNLSPFQMEFARVCVFHGGDYCVARSVDDVIKIGL